MEVKNKSFELLRSLIEATDLRHKVVAQNVANVNTPGYHRLDVTFEDQLQKQLSRGSGGRPETVKPKVIEAQGGTVRADGNNVDIDEEMGNLSKIALLHNLLTQIQGSRTAQMRSAISGR
jgi:flagellar basal-body rod protein FlgB